MGTDVTMQGLFVLSIDADMEDGAGTFELMYTYSVYSFIYNY